MVIDSLLGVWVGVLVALYLIWAKPDFFWEHRKLREARQQLGDDVAERILYGAAAFFGLLFTVLILLTA